MFETPFSGSMALWGLRDPMARAFSSWLESPWDFDLAGLKAGAAFPAMNVWQTDAELCAEVEIPGFKLEDIEVLVVANELTIRGERKESHDAEAAYHRKERASGTFTRSVRLPFDVDPSKVEASVRDGVLTVRLPKAEAVKPRKIVVKGAS